MRAKWQVLRYAVAAACFALVALVGTFVLDFPSLPADPYGHYGPGEWGDEVLQKAYIYDYLDIFYVTAQGEIASERVMLFLHRSMFLKNGRRLIISAVYL